MNEIIDKNQTPIITCELWIDYNGVIERSEIPVEDVPILKKMREVKPHIWKIHSGRCRCWDTEICISDFLETNKEIFEHYTTRCKVEKKLALSLSVEIRFGNTVPGICLSSHTIKLLDSVCADIDFDIYPGVL